MLKMINNDSNLHTQMSPGEPRHRNNSTQAIQMEIFGKTGLGNMIYPNKQGYLSHLMWLPSKLNRAPQRSFTSLRN